MTVWASNMQTSPTIIVLLFQVLSQEVHTPHCCEVIESTGVLDWFPWGHHRTLFLEDVVFKLLTNLLTELYSSYRVAVFVKKGRVSANSHFAWDDDHDTPTDSRLCGYSNLIGKLATVVVHSTAVHKGQTTLDSVAREYSLTIQRADASVGKSGCNDRQSIRVTLLWAALGVKFNYVINVCSLRKSVFRFH